MTNNTPTNRIAKYLGNGHSTKPIAREDYIGKIALVEPPVGTFGAGEYIIVDQTDNALYGVKLGSAFDGSEVKQIPLTGSTAWTIVRVEPDTYNLTESTILLLNDFAATPSDDRHEDLEACIYEGADYAAGALLRMLERRQLEATANGSGSDDTNRTANASDDNPIPVLLVNLSNFDMAFVWLVWFSSTEFFHHVHNHRNPSVPRRSAASRREYRRTTALVQRATRLSAGRFGPNAAAAKARNARSVGPKRARKVGGRRLPDVPVGVKNGTRRRPTIQRTASVRDVPC